MSKVREALLAERQSMSARARLVASWVPARLGGRVDPLETLRTD